MAQGRLFSDFSINDSEDVEESVRAYVEYFNERRPAFALGYLTPPSSSWRDSTGAGRAPGRRGRQQPRNRTGLSENGQRPVHFLLTSALDPVALEDLARIRLVEQVGIMRPSRLPEVVLPHEMFEIRVGASDAPLVPEIPIGRRDADPPSSSLLCACLF